MGNRLIEKIRKLLALGSSPNEHEAKLAVSKANELMEEHQLSMTDVEIKDMNKSQVVSEDYKVKNQKMKLLWIEDLAQGVAKLFDGDILVNTRLHGTSFTFIGFPDDVAMMKPMFEYLYATWHTVVVSDLMKAKETAKMGWKKWEPRDTMLFKQGHGNAFAGAIHARCIEAAKLRSQTVSKTATGTSMVLVKDQAMTDYFDINDIKMSSKSPQLGSVLGLVAGDKAGEEARLNKEIDR